MLVREAITLGHKEEAMPLDLDAETITPIMVNEL